MAFTFIVLRVVALVDDGSRLSILQRKDLKPMPVICFLRDVAALLSATGGKSFCVINKLPHYTDLVPVQEQTSAMKVDICHPNLRG